MTARYPLVLNTTSIQEIQVGDTYDLSQGASLPLATGVSGVLPTANGGTNLSSFTSGGAVYATSTSVLVTGTLPVASGGTNLSSYTANGILFASSTSVLAQSANLSFNSSTNILTVGSGITGGISGGTF